MFLYELVNNYGFSLILFAIVVRLILLPFQMKSKRGMMRQARLQPKLAELQKKHGTNKTKINEEMAKLYKEEGVNPASGCLWSVIPLVVMLALFFAIREPLTMMMGVPADLLASEPQAGAILAKLQELGFQSTVQSYYTQVDQAQFISAHFSQFASLSDALRPLDFNFGILNLGAQPQWNFLWTTDWSNSGIWLHGLVLFIIPLLSAGSQFLATILNKKINPVAAPEGQAKSMQTMMMFMPLMSVYFAFITPAALGFYWTVGTLLQILQDYVLTKRYTKILDAEDIVKNEERKKKEAEIEAKRLETERKKAEGLVERNPNTSNRKKQKSEKQEQIEKTAEWEKKKTTSADDGEYSPSRVGNRRYARGRAYDPERYARFAENSDPETDEMKELPEDTDTDDFSASDQISESADGESDTDDEFDIDSGSDDEPDNEDDDSGDDLADDEASDDGSGDEGDTADSPPTVRFDTTRFDTEDSDQ